MAAREVAEVPAAGATVPLEVRIGFAHASVQWIADRCGADLLHVKGAALDPTLVPDRGFSDADVLVRPAHVSRVLTELRQHGWELINSFAYGSSFEHSATLRHHDFGLLDLHRLYPGAGPTPEAAFTTLWSERRTTTLGGLACAVPARGAQAALLLLHAARGGADPKAARDVDFLWTRATDDERRQVLHWVDRLDARLGFSVILGELDDHRDDPAYDLWRVAARGGTRMEEWRARLRAARGLRAKALVAGRSVLVNVEHLTIVRGRPVSRREVVVEFFDRPLRGAREQISRRRAPRQGRTR
ncbi:putative nucleotidyltransferase-like protein [Humibacillus xanthopallidus]|uniref:Putative nucleotidyltransferase-like protein n=1 Tax=Humibacillus xanthopallidus TaxID=412689 RepID=A0A543PXF7_9MICO|nr:nucleotidyltransferase family protein [Humibacillus xanthopallidus]TQN48767.1 putative nucleotidyltransferase-like protein [Humibacillus xanthopallidus]